jgi:pimeloyl-ACP methyl ester carboxylesterase
MLALLGKVLLVLLIAYGAAVGFGMPMSLPFDVVIASGRFAADPALRAPADGKVRLVVLQHGLWRSPWSLWKLERALAAHGYTVFNPGYPSTAGTVQQHSQRLAGAIAAEVARLGVVDEIYFVGHSLGGLVIADYLRRPDAVTPKACVFLASPLRGAVLADLRKNWWLFQLVMGDKAARQLSPGDALHQLPLRLPKATGTVVGNKGAGNRDIPGDDDGTIAVGEAHVVGESDTVTLPLGHTTITFDDRSIRQVLVFLRDGRFEHE